MHINKDNGGTCYGDSGGPHFVEDEENGLMIVSITSTGDVPCKASDKTARAESTYAYDFLQGFVAL